MSMHPIVVPECLARQLSLMCALIKKLICTGMTQTHDTISIDLKFTPQAPQVSFLVAFVFYFGSKAGCEPPSRQYALAPSHTPESA